MTSAQRVYSMLGNESLWETANRCHQVLADSEIPHSVCGGVAVCLHGYQRNTVDLDMIIRSENSEEVKTLLEQAGFDWQPQSREFRAASGIAIQFLMAGEKAGRDQESTLPDPADPQSTTVIEGLPVLRLAKLIEIKIACGSSNLRRTHKDFADVVELILIRDLHGSFARHLHKSVRPTFRELVRRARAEK